MKLPIPGQDYISVSRQNISPEDKKALREVVAFEQYAEGDNAKEFVHDLQSYFHVPRACLTNSGSSALLADLSAAREASKGKYVITSALGFPTTAATIYQAGFTPWFLDCDPQTLHVPEEIIMDCMVEDDVAGVILAHTLGFPYCASFLRRAIQEKKPDAFLIEDGCDSWGAEYWDTFSHEWVKAGAGGDMAAVSMYPAHQISAGEGGAVLCSNPKFYPAVRSYINWGRDCVCEPGQDNACGKRFCHEYEDLPIGYDHKYYYTRLGYNLKMTEFSAALGRSQLKRLDEFVRQRRQNYQTIRIALNEFPWLNVLPKLPPVRSSPFGVPIQAIGCVNARALIAFLEAHKIGTRPIFAGNLLRHPAFKDLPARKAESFPGADCLMKSAFWIGCWPGWTDAMTNYVCETFRQFELNHPD